MKTTTTGLASTADILVLACCACFAAHAGPHATMGAFASEAEFEDLVRRWHQQTEAPREERAKLLASRPAPRRRSSSRWPRSIRPLATSRATSR